LSDLKVLIVDDNATNREILEHYTRAWRMENACTPGGREALAALRAAAATDKPFELVILDMQMPEMDGLMLAHAIKQDPAICKTRLVMLTSLGNHLDAEDMKKAGIEACVLKPVKQSRLFDRLADVMASHLTRRSARVASGPLPVVPAKAEPHRKKVHILLAEDNRINQMVAQGLLQNLGYTCTTVANGVEVLEALKTKPYEIILMDCQMPEMDGYETTRRIRAAEFASPPRIIAMTANAMRGESEKCLEAGMDDYMSKPVRLDTLRDTIARWLPEGAAK
jgi:CheY-like chemotaxis protein